MNIGEYDQMLAGLLEEAELRWHALASVEAEKREALYPEAELRPVLNAYLAGHFLLTWQLWRQKVVWLAQARANGELTPEDVEAYVWVLCGEMGEAVRNEFEHYVDLQLKREQCRDEHCGCGTDWR